MNSPKRCLVIGLARNSDLYDAQLSAALEYLGKHGYDPILPDEMRKHMSVQFNEREKAKLYLTLLDMSDALVIAPGSNDTECFDVVTKYAEVSGIKILTMDKSETTEKYVPVTFDETKSVREIVESILHNWPNQSGCIQIVNSFNQVYGTISYVNGDIVLDSFGPENNALLNHLATKMSGRGNIEKNHVDYRITVDINRTK